MQITSKSNPKIKELFKLNADRKYREDAGLFVAEGIKPVAEGIKAGVVREIFCTPEHGERFPEATVLSENVFSYVSSEKTPQGVMATVQIPATKPVKPQNSCLLLDRIQDPGNLGTIIRTANAAGFNEIYLINCTDPFSPKCVRASMSGIYFVKLYCGNAQETLSVLNGVPLVCGALEGENIFKFNPPEKFCLCIGNEGNGLSREILNTAEYKINIPMKETCESLNAAVSAGIAMYLLKNK